ncbi:hypothetical protein QBC37DRAFT_7998 [Rhypophila decipiens]|uniref:RRM domain-containing protein n=1 Tax=Rhypophila decipiens TaxID=261697 RepID=A0AAN6YF74_9PEZI|nr:hypothetical protein QBC37DRAFT_7998 [Rhypophila decipiens]
MSTKQPSRVVFVGNIPYGLTEEQIIEIFSSCGPVKNFRLVYDRETGRPKGFGFCQYPDYDSAASAVRNLNDHEIMGRKLRVDFSNETVGDEDNRDQHGGGAGNSNTGNYSQPSNGNANNPPPTGSSALPPLPQGKELPPGVTCTDAISRTLNALPPSQLLDIIQQMKALATNDPARATELLNQAPQLSFAIFQSLLLMGLVSPDAINSVLEAGAPPPAAAPVPVVPPPNPLAAFGAYPGTTGTPPVVVGASGYAPPPAAALPVMSVPAPVPPPAPAAAPAQDPEALMRAVMELPQETIDQLPEAERQQIMALRASYGAQLRR